MNLTVTKHQSPVPVSILHLDGVLDGSNHETLTSEAQKLYKAGARNILLDISRLTFVSSAGLRAFHKVALMFEDKKQAGQEPSYSDFRWSALRGQEPKAEGSPKAQVHVKLLSPTREVHEILDMIGFCALFDVFTDQDQALASFAP
jgi:anti-anti-sigma factor